MAAEAWKTAKETSEMKKDGCFAARGDSFVVWGAPLLAEMSPHVTSDAPH
jgi:hypothetical protein